MRSNASMLVQIAHAARTSMLVRIARAARTAAEATSRFARLAERAALSPDQAVAAASHAPGHAGAGDHRSAAAPPPDALAAPSPAVDASFPFPPHYLKELCSRRKDRVEFVVQEEDLKSDQALWLLYERWCKALDQKRDHDEMVSRFNKFKDTVLRRHRTKNSDLPLKLGKYADGELMEMQANRDGYSAKLAKKVGNSSVLWKVDGSFLREVFADFNVVDGKLSVFTPTGEVELTTKYEVVAGRLFADLPEENKLVIPNDDFILRHLPYY